MDVITKKHHDLLIFHKSLKSSVWPVMSRTESERSLMLLIILFRVTPEEVVLYATHTGHETLKLVTEMWTDMNVLHIILNNGKELKTLCVICNCDGCLGLQEHLLHISLLRQNHCMHQTSLFFIEGLFIYNSPGELFKKF